MNRTREQLGIARWDWLMANAEMPNKQETSIFLLKGIQPLPLVIRGRQATEVNQKLKGIQPVRLCEGEMCLADMFTMYKGVYLALPEDGSMMGIYTGRVSIVADEYEAAIALSDEMMGGICIPLKVTKEKANWLNKLYQGQVEIIRATEKKDDASFAEWSEKIVKMARKNKEVVMAIKYLQLGVSAEVTADILLERRKTEKFRRESIKRRGGNEES